MWRRARRRGVGATGPWAAGDRVSKSGVHVGVDAREGASCTVVSECARSTERELLTALKHDRIRPVVLAKYFVVAARLLQADDSTVSALRNGSTPSTPVTALANMRARPRAVAVPDRRDGRSASWLRRWRGRPAGQAICIAVPMSPDHGRCSACGARLDHRQHSARGGGRSWVGQPEVHVEPMRRADVLFEHLVQRASGDLEQELRHQVADRDGVGSRKRIPGCQNGRGRGEALRLPRGGRGPRPSVSAGVAWGSPASVDGSIRAVASASCPWPANSGQWLGHAGVQVKLRHAPPKARW